ASTSTSCLARSFWALRKSFSIFIWSNAILISSVQNFLYNTLFFLVCIEVESIGRLRFIVGSYEIWRTFDRNLTPVIMTDNILTSCLTGIGRYRKTLAIISYCLVKVNLRFRHYQLSRPIGC